MTAEGPIADTIDSKLRFSDRVADYVLHRPGYPPELVGIVSELTGLTDDWVVADLGSGTGLSSKPFLENGNTVVGVEPNEEMRRAGDEFLRAYPRFWSVNGHSEATDLQESSVDLVVAGQAFHWFDPVRTREECRRIGRPPGWAALVWNVRLTDVNEFARGYERLLRRWGTDYMTYRARRIGPDELRSFFGRSPEERSMPNRQAFDFEGLRGRLLSSSYTPAAGHPDREPMVRELQGLFDEHAVDGRVFFEYETQLFAERLA